LKIHGLAPGAVDGEFGDKTRQVVKQFQREKNLKDDGIVGRGCRATHRSAGFGLHATPASASRSRNMRRATKRLRQRLISLGVRPSAARRAA